MAGNKNPLSPLKGFSLIEVLVALAVFFTICSILWHSAKIIYSGLGTAQQKLKTKRKVEAFLNRVSSDIHNLYLKDNKINLNGTTKHLSLVSAVKTTGTPGLNTLKKINYFLDKQTLKRQGSPLLSIAPGKEENLLIVEKFRFSYLVNNKWSTFCDQKNIPQAIKIKLAISLKNSAKILFFSTIARLNLPKLC